MIRHARFAELDARTLYALLRLRVDVFVVEQQCPYPELDGRDTELNTWHLWTADDDGPTAYLRLLSDPVGSGDTVGGPDPVGISRIGRVCARVDARGAGLAARLVREALVLAGPGVAVLDAQCHLAGWYAQFGFEPNGPQFVEDGIPHVPMRRDPPA